MTCRPHPPPPPTRSTIDLSPATSGWRPRSPVWGRLAAVQGSSLIIALPDVLTGLSASFLTIMWVLLAYLLITTALVPVVGRLAGADGRRLGVVHLAQRERAAEHGGTAAA